MFNSQYHEVKLFICLYSKFISDQESRRSLTNSHLDKEKCDEYVSINNNMLIFLSHKLVHFYSRGVVPET